MSSFMPVVEHMTHKTGKFLFSCECDFSIVYPLIIEARTLYNSVRKLPVLPNIFAELETDLIKRSIFGTAAIEGNPLSEDEVGDILASDAESSAGLKKRAELEIHNLRVLYEELEFKSEGYEQLILEEKYIKNVHKIITNGIDYHHNSPGNYRNEAVKVGDASHGGVYTPPKTLDDVRNLMKIFCEWINSSDLLNLDTTMRAAVAHYHLGMIHPFQDGNGRTSRFIEASILKKSGIKLIPSMMSNYYYRNIDDYFIAFSESRKAKSMTPFLKFYYQGMIESLEEVQDRVVGVLNVVLLRDYLSFNRENRIITVRQYDLLILLIETKKDFSLRSLFGDPIFKSLYKDVAESTARRDIKKLSELGFIVPIEGKKYVLDWEHLSRL
ncbi:Fic family protein [Maridesulfovibrio sp.]|uniref:Fic family protein n=1 Tax=Maridesulfovibrio sp. TaxID=2795000 RepID=UPI0039EF9663